MPPEGLGPSVSDSGGSLPLLTADFSYDLPDELVAQEPAEPRDTSRLMVLGRTAWPPVHGRFSDLPRLLQPGDVLVANRSRVLPARLLGRLEGGGRAELLLLRRRDSGLWEALGRPGRRLRPGTQVALPEGVLARVEACLEDGGRLIRFHDGEGGERQALAHGHAPLPPYIKGWRGDPERYQTVYADVLGSAAAPTAGLHFTHALLKALEAAGIELQYVTLHVGEDTFRPVKTDQAAEHVMHAEHFEVPAATAAALLRAREQGRRIIAVGTTAVRTLETVAPLLLSPSANGAPSASGGSLETGLAGWTRLFILPGHRFRLVDGLITNFHLPRSTLLMLVSAFAGHDRVLAAYAEAIRLRYRFYSFGDAMLLW